MSSGTLRITLFAVFLAASAFGSAVPGTTKVVVRADTRLTDQAFESVGAIRIQDYEAFSVYRVPSVTLAKLQTAAANLVESIEVHDEWNSVIFRNRSIDTRLAADIRNAANDPRVTDELQARSGTFTVVDTSKPVVIVLAWTDEPASVPAGTTLVRDLDLQVHSGCTLYSGNYMNSSEVSVAQNYCGGSVVRDSTNNVEMVVVPAGTFSSMTYSISVHSWFGSHSQKFALFASNVS